MVLRFELIQTLCSQLSFFKKQFVVQRRFLPEEELINVWNLEPV